MRLVSCNCAFLLGLLVWNSSALAVHAAPPQATRMSTGTVVDSLADVSSLKQTVTLSYVGRPLEEVLSGISKTYQVPLQVASRAGTHRVTVVVHAQPLSTVLENIKKLLAHGETSPFGLAWVQQPDGTLYLRRGPKMDDCEKDNLQQPSREALQFLLDCRAFALAPREKRSEWKDKLPYGVYNEPEQNLMLIVEKQTPSQQLSSLFQGKTFSVDTQPLKKTIESEYQWQWEHYGNKLKPLPPLTLPPKLTVRAATLENPVEEPQKVVHYLFCFDESPVSEFSLNPSAFVTDKDVSLTPPPTPVPTYDLSSKLDGATDAQKRDMSFNLAALADKTGLNIYQEHYYREANGFPGRLNTPSGTLAELVKQLCQRWNYQAEQDGDNLYFRSRTWARDNQADIDERQVSQWRTQIQKTGKVTDEQHVALAQQFTWPQIKITLAPAVAASDSPMRIDSNWWRRKYLSNRVVGTLTADEFAASQREEGVLISQLSGLAQQRIADLDVAMLWRGSPREKQIAGLNINNCVLHLNPYSKEFEMPGVDPNSLTVNAPDGTLIWWAAVPEYRATKQ